MSNAAEQLQHASQPYASELVELDSAEQQLAELKKKYGTVPDYTTKTGYEQGKKAIQALTKMRTGTDKARLAITEPHRDFVTRVNERAKALIGEVEKLEKPHREAKKEVDEAEQRKKEERIARLRERLEKEVTSYLDTAAGLDAAGLADLITAAEGIDTGDYFDVTKEAEDEKARVLHELNALHARTLEQERLAAERAELERERAELERLKAQQAEPSKVVDRGPSSYGIPAEDMADIGELIEGHRDQAGFAGLRASSEPAEPIWPSDDPADPFGQALQDLQSIGLDASSAVDVLSAIQRGEVRHLSFTSGE